MKNLLLLVQIVFLEIVVGLASSAAPVTERIIEESRVKKISEGSYIFEKHDADKNGKLSKEEYMVMWPGVDKAHKEKKFTEKDSDKDGFLSMAEFKSRLKVVTNALASAKSSKATVNTEIPSAEVIRKTPPGLSQ